MAFILNIETATPLCSVALALDGKTQMIFETQEEKSHAARLTVFIEKILKEKGIEISQLNAISVGKGPGSYTGLRIGVSAAKGLCYGSNLPLIATGTLEILLQEVLMHHYQDIDLSEKADTLFCPMIDARRMEVFTCIYDKNHHEIEPVSARIIDKDSFLPYLKNHQVVFFGSGMDKCREMIDHPNAVFISGIYPHASALATLSEKKYVNQQFENLAYFEPFYLKDFVATVSKKGLQV